MTQKRIQMKGVLPWLVRWACRTGTRDLCSALAALVGGVEITINVPVVFMVRYVMILRGATSLLGALEGVGPENRDFLGPEMARAKRVSFGPKNWYIGSFMDPGAVVVCCCVLLCVVVCCCVLLCVRGVGRSPCSCIV